MPKLFRIGKYIVFFWSKENDEPIHIHIAIVDPTSNATKIWITKNGGCIVAHNKSKIPEKDLNRLLRIIENDYDFICQEWKNHFETDEIKFYC
ncbi:MAG: DUF4160 domain-containing protein [Oscillospiraceae bacterium]|nr:DUF4160 domain-containing protein [Oscillospiraceae bacterium]